MLFTCPDIIRSIHLLEFFFSLLDESKLNNKTNLIQKKTHSVGILLLALEYLELPFYGTMSVAQPIQLFVSNHLCKGNICNGGHGCYPY